MSMFSGLKLQPASVTLVIGELSDKSLEALRAMIHEEVRSALDLEEQDAHMFKALRLCRQVLGKVPVDLECDADWRATRDQALAQVDGLLIPKG